MRFARIDTSNKGAIGSAGFAEPIISPPLLLCESQPVLQTRSFMIYLDGSGWSSLAFMYSFSRLLAVPYHETT
jgi:hypothetical protein